MEAVFQDKELEVVAVAVAIMQQVVLELVLQPQVPAVVEHHQQLQVLPLVVQVVAEGVKEMVIPVVRLLMVGDLVVELTVLQVHLSLAQLTQAVAEAVAETQVQVSRVLQAVLVL